MIVFIPLHTGIAACALSILTFSSSLNENRRASTLSHYMPRIKAVTKSCCPLCEELQELKYRYDICEECHQDLIKDVDSEIDPDSQNDVESESDADTEPEPEDDTQPPGGVSSSGSGVCSVVGPIVQ